MGVQSINPLWYRNAQYQTGESQVFKVWQHSPESNPHPRTQSVCSLCDILPNREEGRQAHFLIRRPCWPPAPWRDGTIHTAARPALGQTCRFTTALPISSSCCPGSREWPFVLDSWWHSMTSRERHENAPLEWTPDYSRETPSRVQA